MTIGAIETLFISFMCPFSSFIPGDEVIIPTQTFSLYESFAQPSQIQKRSLMKAFIKNPRPDALSGSGGRVGISMYLIFRNIIFHILCIKLHSMISADI